MSLFDPRSAASRSYRAWYWTPRWRKIRAQQLAAYPLCIRCQEQGAITPATICDHVDKASKATVEGFFAGPFQSLCKNHHDSAKQREEARGHRDDIDAEGWPTDPRHLANRTRQAM
jgi:5-methylcytosine-specific restriction enzyme A